MNFLSKHSFALLFGSTLLCHSVATGAERPGQITYLTGAVTVNGTRAAVGTYVGANDKISVSDRGGVRILMNDKTSLEAYESSELVVTENGAFELAKGSGRIFSPKNSSPKILFSTTKALFRLFPGSEAYLEVGEEKNADKISVSTGTAQVQPLDGSTKSYAVVGGKVASLGASSSQRNVASEDFFQLASFENSESLHKIHQAFLEQAFLDESEVGPGTGTATVRSLASFVAEPKSDLPQSDRNPAEVPAAVGRDVAHGASPISGMNGSNRANGRIVLPVTQGVSASVTVKLNP